MNHVQSAQDSKRVLSSLGHLLKEFKDRPLDILPERSVEAVSSFLNGYAVFVPGVFEVSKIFDRWLASRLHYPNDSGRFWTRRIQLNARDACEGFDTFKAQFRAFLHQRRIESLPIYPAFVGHRCKIDFFETLYMMSHRPGFWFGSGGTPTLLAAWLAGYFRAKADNGVPLNRDERKFLRFEEWLKRHHKFPKVFPWYRVVEMWTNPGPPLKDFFDQFDAYLTDYGKKPFGLEDLFKVVTTEGSTTVLRRTKEERPRKALRLPETQRWWRMR